MNKTKFIDKMLENSTLPETEKLELLKIFNRLYEKHTIAKTKHDMGILPFYTTETLNYMKAYNISNTALLHEHQYFVHNLWASIFKQITGDYDGFTTQEKTLLHCLQYYVLAETLYDEVVSKVCFILVWQTSPPEKIHGCKTDTIRDISNISLGTRIEFLQKNGFEDLANAFNKDFRNAIAHNDIIIGKPKLTTTRTGSMESGSVNIESKTTIEGDNIKMRLVTGSFTDVDVLKIGPTLRKMTYLYKHALSMLFTIEKFYSLINFKVNGEKPKLTFGEGKTTLSWNPTRTNNSNPHP